MGGWGSPAGAPLVKANTPRAGRPGVYAPENRVSRLRCGEVQAAGAWTVGSPPRLPPFRVRSVSSGGVHPLVVRPGALSHASQVSRELRTQLLPSIGGRTECVFCISIPLPPCPSRYFRRQGLVRVGASSSALWHLAPWHLGAGLFINLCGDIEFLGSALVRVGLPRSGGTRGCKALDLR